MGSPSTTGGARLRYTVDIDDIVAYNIFHNRTSPHAARVRRTQRLVTIVLSLVVAAIAWSFIRDWSAFLFIAAITVAVATFRNLGSKSTWDKNIEKQVRSLFRDPAMQTTLGEKTCEILDDRLVQSSAHVGSSNSLVSLHRILCTTDHLFIQLNPIHAVVIPRRKIDEGDFDAFRQELESRCPAIVDPASVSDTPAGQYSGNPYSPTRS